MGLTRGRVGLVVALLALVLSATGGSGQATNHPGQLFRGAYISTAVTKDGERHPLFEGTEIRVGFERRDEYDVVGWRARCNRFGASVKITDERLVTGQIAGTDMGCPKPLARQDNWMVRFFASDPNWRARRGRTLKLTAGDRVIQLRPR